MLDTTVKEVKALDKDIISAQTVQGIKLEDTANMSSAVVASGKLDTSKTTKLYVVNEKEAAGVDLTATAATALDALVTSGDAHVYHVYAVKAPAEKGTKLLSLTSDSDKNVTVAKKGDTYTITVPNTYGSDNTKTFGLNFSVSRLATLYAGPAANSELPTAGLVSDGGKKLTGYSEFKIDSNELTVGSDALTSSLNGYLNVAAEDGTSTESYKLVVKVAEKEKGAAIKSLKVGNTAATISGKTINLTLPFGTELYPVKLDITADKMLKSTAFPTIPPITTT